ncbi:MAG: cupin domain-containing protein [Calditrichaceae bacterium]|nr:cupin domain-containing protein [Calditrichaceae bacterium]MBN2708910.1 cupin domain-containing protein [Calditrichaceae bacterium]
MTSFSRLYRSNELSAREMPNGGKVKLIHTGKMTFAEWHFKKGTHLAGHSHPHEQITRVLEGIIELTIEGNRFTLHAGDTLHIASDAKHSGRILEECRLIDVFTPVREDLK